MQPVNTLYGSSWEMWFLSLQVWSILNYRGPILIAHSSDSIRISHLTGQSG